jgi:F-type H+-transporting ATPase subunit epsilon
MSFTCTVVTPEAEAFNGTITQAILPAHDGQMGILTDRSPLLVKLGTGPLRVDAAGGQSQYFFIDGGIAQMKDNKLTILTQESTPATALDAAAAQAEYDAAVAKQATGPAETFARQRQMARARGKQQTVEATR